jgi:hypothetical protein
MAILQHDYRPVDQRRSPLLAWCISLATHLALLLAIWLVMASAWGARPPLPRERMAAIVLRPRSDRSAMLTTEVPPPNEGTSRDVPAAQSAQVDSSPTQTLGSYLPAGALPPSTETSVALPNMPLDLGAGNGVVTTLRPEAGPGGRPKLPFALIDEAAVLADDARIPRKIVPTGPTASLEMFGAVAEGRSFVFVIDRSQSMGGDGVGGIAAVAHQLQARLASLSADQRFQVIAYNESITYFQGRKLLAATPESQQALTRYVEKLAAYGPTEHERGLLAALALEPEVIFLFTDGGDPHLKPGQLASLRARAAEMPTSIHVIHFSREREPAGDPFLRRLAEENRGTYWLVRP